ncbi:MAG: hypothetical protein NXI18_21880 [Alphaproteobacteria bacterium]|nr:hypothetical protein [Alphaproteobacteria bacterium]
MASVAPLEPETLVSCEQAEEQNPAVARNRLEELLLQSSDRATELERASQALESGSATPKEVDEAGLALGQVLGAALTYCICHAELSESEDCEILRSELSWALE